MNVCTHPLHQYSWDIKRVPHHSVSNFPVKKTLYKYHVANLTTKTKQKKTPTMQFNLSIKTNGDTSPNPTTTSSSTSPIRPKIGIPKISILSDDTKSSDQQSSSTTTKIAISNISIGNGTDKKDSRTNSPISQQSGQSDIDAENTYYSNTTHSNSYSPITQTKLGLNIQVHTESQSSIDITPHKTYNYNNNNNNNNTDNISKSIPEHNTIDKININIDIKQEKTEIV
eukprot:314859_1